MTINLFGFNLADYSRLRGLLPTGAVLLLVLDGGGEGREGSV